MIAFIVVLIFVAICSYIGYLVEKRQWNCGVNRKTGERWRFLTIDSSGARCYHDGHGNEIWISWNIEKR